VIDTGAGVKDWLDDFEFDEIEPQIAHHPESNLVKHDSEPNPMARQPMNFFGIIVARP